MCCPVQLTRAELESIKVGHSEIEHACLVQAGYISTFPTVTPTPGHVARSAGDKSLYLSQGRGMNGVVER